MGSPTFGALLLARTAAGGRLKRPEERPANDGGAGALGTNQPARHVLLFRTPGPSSLGGCVLGYLESMELQTTYIYIYLTIILYIYILHV